jgi:3-oxoacyl-[acyl-carrier-protein] synthase II
MAQRVVITGTGVVTPLGFDNQQILSALKSGQTNFERSDVDPDCVVCPVKNFNLLDYAGKFKNRRYLNSGASFSVAAALMALNDAHLNKDSLTNAGLFIGAGPNLDIEKEFTDISNGKAKWSNIQALWLLKFLPNTAASIITQLTGIHGECATLGTACAASLQAIGNAYHNIKDGYINVAVTGGGDSRLSKGGLMGYKKAHAIYCGDGIPEETCRPFDQNRDGFVPGEGAAFFVLESLAHATNRGATIIAEIIGFGASMDGYQMAAPHPDGIYARMAIEKALHEANINIHEIDLIAAHGTGTHLNDIMEAKMIKKLFVSKNPRIIAIKSWIGHLAAACGAAELAICLACMQNNYIPEIRNLIQPCHQLLNFVKTPEKVSFNTLLLENFGFGGQNCAIIVSKLSDQSANGAYPMDGAK